MENNENIQELLKKVFDELTPKEIIKERNAKEQVINSLNEYLRFDDDIFWNGESTIRIYKFKNIEVRDYKKEKQA